MLSLKLVPRHASTSPLSTATAASLIAVATIVTTISYSKQEPNNEIETKDQEEQNTIDVDFMDKLASKPYVNFHSLSSRHQPPQPRRGGSKILSNDDNKNIPESTSSEWKSDKSYNEYYTQFFDGDVGVESSEGRPRGIPQSVRILAIDVPEMRNVFRGGKCRVNLNRVFPDDIAPRKRIVMQQEQKQREKHQKGTFTGKNMVKAKKQENSHSVGDKNDSYTVEIIQKSLARSLVQCRSQHQINRVGIELLEASIHDLNPNNMRRLPLFQSQYPRHHHRHFGKGVKKEEEEDDDVDEIDAPWNQYAWIEEMQIRIYGRVPFGAPLQRSSYLSRLIYGNTYKHTIPPTRHPLFRWFLPNFLFFGVNDDNGDGIDGDTTTLNRSSSKPHVVIADGTSLHRMPGSLRFLTKCCREADVPLFVINDPRVWASNNRNKKRDIAAAREAGEDKKDEFNNAVGEMKKVLKDRLIRNVLRIKEGTAFERGRALGRLENESKWQAKEWNRKVRDILGNGGNEKEKKKEEDEDWSVLDEKELYEKLAKHKVITLLERSNSTDEHTLGKDQKQQGKGTQQDQGRGGIDNIGAVTNSFIEICKRCCLENQNMNEEDRKK